ncbi:hypothetical protein [Amycolatopsis magusensis]|uniref:Uncharacterized protein n=1 Tax=Amycolatopsis magusensis TaxID=882444 RepID=A0ABS4Q2L4_9PSEU|nr:hypothetical protein [Amycolatopsis magusensis]MBP2185920.1 hypothetical protein [Amycolatopsis magusensis]MDI5977700.1 hypothetical protein [Amycolatopsis magusensis]
MSTTTTGTKPTAPRRVRVCDLGEHEAGRCGCTAEERAWRPSPEALKDYARVRGVR